MEQAIKISAGAGWNRGGIGIGWDLVFQGDRVSWRGGRRKEDGTGTMWTQVSYAILREDPDFWKYLIIGLAKENKGLPVVNGWKYLWHEYIDHIGDGKDADRFFTNLIKNK